MKYAVYDDNSLVFLGTLSLPVHVRKPEEGERVNVRCDVPVEYFEEVRDDAYLEPLPIATFKWLSLNKSVQGSVRRGWLLLTDGANPHLVRADGFKQ